jgi:hypothetical protein
MYVQLLAVVIAYRTSSVSDHESSELPTETEITLTKIGNTNI